MTWHADEHDQSLTPMSHISPGAEGSRHVLCVGERVAPGAWIGTTTTAAVKQEGCSATDATVGFQSGSRQTGSKKLRIIYAITDNAERQ